MSAVEMASLSQEDRHADSRERERSNLGPTRSNLEGAAGGYNVLDRESLMGLLVERDGQIVALEGRVGRLEDELLTRERGGAWEPGKGGMGSLNV